MRRRSDEDSNIRRSSFLKGRIGGGRWGSKLQILEQGVVLHQSPEVLPQSPHTRVLQLKMSGRVNCPQTHRLQPVDPSHVEESDDVALGDVLDQLLVTSVEYAVLKGKVGNKKGVTSLKKEAEAIILTTLSVLYSISLL